ncbi:class I SAM-dependent methyltransferase [Candidatus Latescibacterota bacterium]
MVKFKDRCFENEPCIVCGSSDFKQLKIINNRKILRCIDCGLFFVGEIHPHDLEGFYEYQYYHNTNNDLIGYREYTTDYNSDYNNYIRIAKLLIKYEDNGKKLLDVGAAHGVFVKVMNDTGWDAQGIDPSFYAVNTGISKYGVNLRQDTIEGFQPEGTRFDVITLIGVFEHLTSPDESLEKIYNMLNPGGLLLITTLNAGRYIHIYKFKPPEHLFYFNRPQLSRLLIKKGFHVIKAVPYLRSYRFSEFTHRVNALLFPKLLNPCDWLFSHFPILDIIARFPTNEMFILARKE